MEEYRIKFLFTKSKQREVEIISDKLLYGEVYDSSVCQVNNPENKDLIHKKCKKIANLIREIDKLNK